MDEHGRAQSTTAKLVDLTVYGKRTIESAHASWSTEFDVLPVVASDQRVAVILQERPNGRPLPTQVEIDRLFAFLEARLDAEERSRARLRVILTPLRQHLHGALKLVLPAAAASALAPLDALARETSVSFGCSADNSVANRPPFLRPLHIEGADRFARHSSHSSHSSHYSSSSGGSGRSYDSLPTINQPTTTQPLVSPPTSTSDGLLVAMRAQLELKRLGYYTGPIDGVVGPGTRDAVARFQQAQGLVQTGLLDNVTLAKLGVSPQ